jgi:hypothetical protein
MKILPMWAELFRAYGQTDTTKLEVPFRNFANAPKKASFLISVACFTRNQRKEKYSQCTNERTNSMCTARAEGTNLIRMCTTRAEGTNLIYFSVIILLYKLQAIRCNSLPSWGHCLTSMCCLHGWTVKSGGLCATSVLTIWLPVCWCCTLWWAVVYMCLSTVSCW